MITCVIPCYNEEDMVEKLYHELLCVITAIPETSFEFLFVDDGSKDRTLSRIKQLADADQRVYYLSFSRNFGKEAAIYAGLEHARGEYVVIMDADLQDPPSMIPKMYQAIKEEGYDCVGARRISRRGEPPIRSFCARIFYKLINRMSRTEVVDGARDFQMMNHKVVEAILAMGEYNRFSKGIFSWVGFSKKWLAYENVERAAGETKWSFCSLFLYAIDGIIAFSTAPLALASWLGIFCFILAVILIIVIIVKTLIFGDPTSGWPSMACLVLLLSGTQLLCIGILGQYLARTYLETKRRPIYLLRETNQEDIIIDNRNKKSPY